MAYAVTHILVVIVILELARHYVFGKNKFPRYLVVIGGIAGLMPDIDIPLGWVYNFVTGIGINFHGMFTHSFVFVALFAILGLVLQIRKNMQWAKIFYVIAFGWFMHLALDCLYGGYKTFFWPFQIAAAFCPQTNLYYHAESIDAILRRQSQMYLHRSPLWD